MRNKKWSVMLAVMLLMVVGISCRSLSTATPDEVDPAAIEASIRSQILMTYPSETFDIGISVSREGVVTLSGSVDSRERRNRIGDLARSVAGVTRVVNELKVD
jgi:hyperosmotically inducible periplasmic protein